MKIVGSIVEDQKVRPFIFDDETEKIVLDEFSWDRAVSLDFFDEMDLRQRIREVLSFAEDEIRIGEYFCSSCQKWRKATSQEWSYGICLSCSLDRDSDYSDSIYD